MRILAELSGKKFVPTLLIIIQRDFIYSVDVSYVPSYLPIYRLYSLLLVDRYLGRVRYR